MRSIIKLFQEFKAKIIGRSVNHTADSFNLDRMFEDSLLLYKDKQYRKSKKAFENLANQGHPQSQHYLGLIYLQGLGIRKNLTQSFNWFQKAALNNYAPAQVALFECYRDGDGVQANSKKSIEWCLRAADQGYTDAMHNMGINYMNGYGVPLNMTEALNWFLKAADNNFLLSQYSAAYMYLKGDGIEKNYEEALFWLLIARENSPCHFGGNDPFLMECFGQAYSENDKKVYDMIEKAIKTIPVRVKRDASITNKVSDWITIHASTDNVDYNKTLKWLVKKTLDKT